MKLTDHESRLAIRFANDFENAARIGKEIEESKWSPATGAFGRASVLVTLAETLSDAARKQQLIKQACEIFEYVPSLKKNFGGKR